MYPDIFAHKIEQLPNKPFLAILKQSSYTTTDYGQDNTNNYLEMEIYHDEAAWKKEIEKLTLAQGFFKKEFKAIRVEPINPVVTVTV